MTARTKSIAQASGSTEVVESEGKLNPGQAAVRRMVETTLVRNIVDDEVRQGRLDDTAKAIAVFAFLGVKSDVARLEMFNAIVSTRIMFPATEKVRALLGDDAPDLAGESPEYTEAIGGVYDTDRAQLVSRLRRDGYLGEDATNIAKARVDSLRKTVSLDYRKHMELIASEQANPAAFLLAHGFGYNTAVGTKKNPQAIPQKTSAVFLAEDGSLIVGNEGDVLVQDDETKAWKAVRPTPKAGDATPANEPNEQSDQTTPSQQADALIKAAVEAAGGSVLDPFALIHQSIGMLNSAADLLPKTKTTLKERNHARTVLLAAVKRVVGELEDGQEETVGAVEAVVSKAAASK